MGGETRNSSGRQNYQLLKLQQNRFFALKPSRLLLAPHGMGTEGIRAGRLLDADRGRTGINMTDAPRKSIGIAT